MNRTAKILAILALALSGTSDAFAQNGRGGPKPFESIYRRPAVSPMNNLTNFATNPMAQGNIYQQLVVPQMQQQQQQIEAMAQGRQINRLQNQVQQIQRTTTARQIDETIRPTGHASTYQNLSHFYPAAR